ncbi:MAG: DUF481 domain-containing protein [Pirellulaceae bacterium]
MDRPFAGDALLDMQGNGYEKDLMPSIAAYGARLRCASIWAGWWRILILASCSSCMVPCCAQAQLPADAWPPLVAPQFPTPAYSQAYPLPPGADDFGVPPPTLPPLATPPLNAPLDLSPPLVPLTGPPAETLPAGPVSDDSQPTNTLPIETQPADSLTGESPPPVMEEAAWETGTWWLPIGWEEWFLAKLWSGGLEIGINSTEGNAEAFSSRFGGNLKRKSELWEFKADATYAKSTANGNETQHNALFNSGYERAFGETNWSHFGKLNLEYDEFKAFDLRLAMNMGLGYQFLKSDVATVKTRFGAGTSHEINSPDSRWVAEAVFGLDISHQLSSRQKIALTSDYFPEWGDFSNFRLVTDASWSVALDDASKLSLKLSVNERYDSTPNGRKPTDIIYALLLLWQL